MPTREDMAAAQQRGRDATAQEEVSLNPQPSAAAAPPNFEAAFTPSPASLLRHNNANLAVHSRIGQGEGAARMAPLNAMQPRRVITDVNGRAIARAGRGHAARGIVGMSKRVRRDPLVPHPAHNAPPLNPPPIQNFNNDNDDSSNNSGMQQEEEDSSSDARSVQNNLQHQQPLMDDDGAWGRLVERGMLFPER
jgi:hypothetical protein